MTSQVAQGREDQAIGQVSERLQVVFRDRGSSEVAGVVTQVARRFAAAPIRDFVPLLVERISRDELNHRFAAPGRRPDERADHGHSVGRGQCGGRPEAQDRHRRRALPRVG